MKGVVAGRLALESDSVEDGGGQQASSAQSSIHELLLPRTQNIRRRIGIYVDVHYPAAQRRVVWICLLVDASMSGFSMIERWTGWAHTYPQP